jgi:hypothetical protein
MAKQTDLQKAYEAALLKGLTSDTAAERVAAIKAVSDRENPALGELTTKLKQAEDRLDEAKSSLKEITTERDTLAAKVVELQPLADKAGELDALKLTFDSRVADARKELVSESQQRQFAAERAERAAADRLQEAERKFSTSGLEVLMDAMRNLIETHYIPQPDIWSLPKNVNPFYLTLWPDWTPIKAQLFVYFTQTYTEPTEGFKQELLRLLLPTTFEGAPSAPVADISTKIEVMSMMASRWQVLAQIQRQVEQRQVEILGQHMLNNSLSLAAQERDHIAQGLTREAQIQPQSSVTGFTGICLEGCICARCQPGLRHRNSIDEIEEVL